MADSGCIAGYNYMPVMVTTTAVRTPRPTPLPRPPSTTVVTVTGGESFTYDGYSHPATVSVAGAGGLQNLTPPPSYGCGHAPIDVADSGCIPHYS